MENRLVAKDYRLFVFCTIIAIVSLFVISRFFYRAFPEASIDFRITRNQSKPIAEKYLSDLGFDITAFRHSAIFSYDEDAKTFLEKELGAEKANQLMGKKIRLWRWANRWYKPLEKEEFLVHVSPGGDIIGFRHQIAEEQQGAVLSADSARAVASDFLFRNLALDSQNLEFVEESSQERPNRMDFSFTWKEKDFEVMEATYRYRVDIYGDQIGALEEFLHVPEKWSRDYEKLRAKNETTGMVSGFFLFLTLFAIIVMGIVHTRHRDIRWKTAAIYGIIAAVLTFLSLINRLPLTQFNYPTTESYQSFILRQVLVNIVNAILAGAAIFLLTAAAEPIYREKYPRFVSLSNLFRWQSIRSKKFFIGVIVGLTMTFFFAAYQVTFYLLSNRFGAWAPQQIPYDNMLNTTFPWIYVLLIGFMPAVSEEFISRLFSIPFFHKIIRVQWLAVVIPAFIWGFAHSSYPQQPFYIRGIEVGIAGIIIGYIMLRFGILAPLIWHYTVDALYTALVFLRSGNWYFISTAAISCGIMLLPLIIALVAYLRNRTFAMDDDLRNSADGITREYSPVKLFF